ncbi:MAG: putative parvulin-type peptidyl-prolyl cis-trans isomerase [Burkholderiaceae bacterium]|nr:putative parvulin-type peptidyl-prolyl cis-trans isomerase [Burkholderiaceae bacterium]
MTEPIRIARLACIAVLALSPLAALAQNVAIVNGKPVPKARVDTLLNQAVRGGQPRTPELEQRAREEVVLREIFAQEAEKRGVAQSADYRSQMELVRQTVLIRELFEQFKKKNPVTDAEARAEYDKVKAQASGTEYHARHILVEKEDEAKKLIAQIKGGAKFEELAKKNSKDTGSGEKGGDLDFAKPDAYVPEFSKAMTALKKGEMTETPVKTQFGYHIIRLEDTREATFPDFDAVKPQLEQRIAQLKLQKYQEDLRKAAKTDFKFPNGQ